MHTRKVHRRPRIARSYTIKVHAPRNHKGEYAAGKTLAEARREAADFAAHGDSGRIGYFTFGKADPEDGRFHEVSHFGPVDFHSIW